jgi:hypothetical protein
MSTNVTSALKSTLKRPLICVFLIVALAELWSPAAAQNALNPHKTTPAGMYFVSNADAGNQPIEFATGDIVIIVKDENNEPVNGSTFRLILPGADGDIEKLPNILFEVTDGEGDDADGVDNGHTVFKADIIGPYIADTAGYLVSVEKKGYIRLPEEERLYSIENINIVEIVLKSQKSTWQVQ